MLWVSGAPWALTDRILRPLTMPHRMAPVDRAAIRAALKDSGALFAQWTEGWDTQACEWWHICCDQRDYDISQFRKVARYDVRRGLQECEVRKVDNEWFAENGFPVYAAAFRQAVTIENFIIRRRAPRTTRTLCGSLP